jgi:hypothetical protein
VDIWIWVSQFLISTFCLIDGLIWVVIFIICPPPPVSVGRIYCGKKNWKHVHPVLLTLPTFPVTLESRSLSLLGRCSRQLRRSCADANMVYSRAEHVLVLEHYFASTSLACSVPRNFVTSRYTCCLIRYFLVRTRIAKCFTNSKPRASLARVTHRPDDGGSKYLWNVGKRLLDYMAEHPRRQSSLYSPLWEPEMSPIKCFLSLFFR